MSATKSHVPAPGYCSGKQGPALCGRWAHYATGDHRLIEYLARTGPDGEDWCKNCLRKLRPS